MGQTAHSSQTHMDLAVVAQLHPTPSFFGLREDRGDLESLSGFVTTCSQNVRRLSFLVLYT